MNQKIPDSITPESLHEWIFDKSMNLAVVDVREDQELEIAPFPYQVIHIPLSKASELAPIFLANLSSDQKVVVICHSGIRSWNFASWMIEQKCKCNVWNLIGGIEAWSLRVDPSVPRY